MLFVKLLGNDIAINHIKRRLLAIGSLHYVNGDTLRSCEVNRITNKAKLY